MTKYHFTRRDAVELRRGPPGCQLYRADRWKPAAYPKRRFYFCIMDYGNGYYVMRLFDTAADRDLFERRVKNWCGVQPQSRGCIRFKTPPKATIDLPPEPSAWRDIQRYRKG